MKFLCLTGAHGSPFGSFEKFIINSDLLLMVEHDDRTNGACLHVVIPGAKGGIEFIYVTETVKAIYDMLKGQDTKWKKKHLKF